MTEADDEESGTTLAERLPAQASSDPLIYLLAREAAFDAEEHLQGSYSQAAAYIIAFDNLRATLNKPPIFRTRST